METHALLKKNNFNVSVSVWRSFASCPGEVLHLLLGLLPPVSIVLSHCAAIVSTYEDDDHCLLLTTRCIISPAKPSYSLASAHCNTCSKVQAVTCWHATM